MALVLKVCIRAKTRHSSKAVSDLAALSLRMGLVLSEESKMLMLKDVHCTIVIDPANTGCHNGAAQRNTV